ncbi:DUF4132 domain-containing protein [Chitinophaga sp. MM2321]|uniref:DUF4132 domain-containing protein n=1 Tax=Chitinophaga sp. MM2321 TaxID=3137178 RepID=UPI0032D592AB
MPYTKEHLLPLVEKLEQLYDYDNIEVYVQAGIDFLTGRTITVPEFQEEEAARLMSIFISLLRLPDQWEDNDRLVLQLIAPPLTWQHCSETFLLHVVPLMDAPGTSSSIVLRFSYFTSFLQQRGCTPEEIGSFLISYSGDGNNFDLAPLKFTPLRKFLQDLIKSAEWNIVDAYLRTWKNKGWNSLFFRLLSKGHPDREMDYLENILLQPGKDYVNYELSRTLLQTNADKYLPLIEKATGHLSALPDYSGQLTGYYLLAGHQPEKYNTLLVNAAYTYLREYYSSMAGHAYRQQQAAMKGSADLLPPDVIAVKELLLQDKNPAIHYLDQYLTEKKYLHQDVFNTILELLQEQAAPLLLKALENDYDARQVLPLLTQLNQSLYLEQLWDFTLHKLKSVRTLVAVILADHPQALEKAGELLLHRKADQRLTAVQILCKLHTPAAKTLLQQALHKEINDDARDLMLDALGDPITGDDDAVTTAQLVTFAKKRGKLSKPLETWLDVAALPPLFLQDDSTLPPDMMRFLLYRMSRITAMQPDVEARPLLRLIDRSRSGDFAAHLLKLYTDKAGDVRLKYLLALAALVGDEQLADHLYSCICQWIAEKRLKIAEQGVAALVLHGSNNALRAVEFLSRKYRVRKSSVGAAALAGLENAAEELGISIHELGDRIVPDFGFKNLSRSFAVKGDIYRVYIDNNFKPAFINSNDRRLKSIPTATPVAIKDAFKALGKEVAEVAKLQSLRLEQYLVEQRKWKAAQWQQCFLHNPIMFVCANRLLWAIYDRHDKLITCFLCRENGRLTGLQQEQITIPEDATVRILHPLYLDTATGEQWKQQLAALRIILLFPQLDKPEETAPPVLYQETTTDTAISPDKPVLV